jgi:hypothetical protein
MHGCTLCSGGAWRNIALTACAPFIQPLLQWESSDTGNGQRKIGARPMHLGIEARSHSVKIWGAFCVGRVCGSVGTRVMEDDG